MTVRIPWKRGAHLNQHLQHRYFTEVSAVHGFTSYVDIFIHTRWGSRNIFLTDLPIITSKCFWQGWMPETKLILLIFWWEVYSVLAFLVFFFLFLFYRAINTVSTVVCWNVYTWKASTLFSSSQKPSGAVVVFSVHCFWIFFYNRKFISSHYENIIWSFTSVSPIAKNICEM